MYICFQLIWRIPKIARNGKRLNIPTFNRMFSETFSYKIMTKTHSITSNLHILYSYRTLAHKTPFNHLSSNEQINKICICFQNPRFICGIAILRVFLLPFFRNSLVFNEAHVFFYFISFFCFENEM